MYKKIYDPVHGFIRFSSLEKKVIDSYVFQRLHYVRQLGATYLVYPGATHTRFEHSLGVMEVASQIFDRITSWPFPCAEKPDLAYWRQIVRLAALCHDLGHLPFSHLAEKHLLGSEGHEEWTMRAIQSDLLLPIWQELGQQFPGRTVVDDLLKISIGRGECSPWEKVMSQIITGDFFGADRIDYLLRDARYTGVSYGLFDYQQLIETLRILPSIEGGLTLGIEESGIESCEALLLGRHFMYKRVYQHPSVQAYSFHVRRFMTSLYEKYQPLSSLESYLLYTDNEILQEIKLAFLDKCHKRHEDALAIFCRDHRYLALEIPSSCQEDDVVAWRCTCNIHEEQAVISYTSKDTQLLRLAFPVKKGDKIVDAATCSSLSIPHFNPSWLYVAPMYEDKLSFLQKGC